MVYKVASINFERKKGPLEKKTRQNKNKGNLRDKILKVSFMRQQFSLAVFLRALAGKEKKEKCKTVEKSSEQAVVK